jgi:putative membrane protein
VIGDSGIHARVGDAYWASIRDHMVTSLRTGAARDALVGAVDRVARVLREHFPRRPGDVQDSSDDLTVL